MMEKTVKNGHLIVFDKCSWPHQQLVLEFIKESLVNDKIITIDSKISKNEKTFRYRGSGL